MHKTKENYCMILLCGSPQDMKTEVACSCGFHGLLHDWSISSCPQCHAKTHCQMGRSVKVISKKVKMEDEVTFSIEARHGVFVPDFRKEEGEKLSYHDTSIRKFSMQLIPNPKVQIEIDGTPQKATKASVAKALANLSPHDIPDGLIRNLSDHIHRSTLSGTVNYLLQYPWIEKFWSCDKSMAIAKMILGCEKELDIRRYEATPNKILGLTRSLYHTYLKNSIRFCGNLQYHDLLNVIDKFGQERTETILRHLVDLTDPEGYEACCWPYLSLLMRTDVQYDPETLYEYLGDRIYTYQGITSPSLGGKLLADYLDVCRELGVKPDKYPKSLHLTHDIAIKNYKIVLNQKIKEQFLAAVDKYKDLAYQGKDYSVIVPSCADDVVNEGASLSHCVGSYINKIINEGVQILFMRHTSDPDTPLITLDIRNGFLYQAAGFGNRDLSSWEADFIKEWAKAKHINPMM